LDNNLLSQIPTGLFHPLKNLRLLSLTYNQLKVLHQDTFQENKKLTDLGFTYNKIKAVARGTFANLPALKYVSLLENVCIDQQFGDYETLTNVKDSDEALKNCYANYEKL
jgi:hypothetical protein